MNKTKAKIGIAYRMADDSWLTPMIRELIDRAALRDIARYRYC